LPGSEKTTIYINHLYIMSKIYHLDAPNAGRIEKKYLTKAIDSGYISTFGPFVGQFEKKFAKFLGAKKAVALQSGTAALHMSLLEAGIGDGDEVIVPCLTFVATVNPVLYVGAKPVLADVSPDTWNIQPEEIESHITTKTKAIIPVHLFGTCCDMGRIMEIAQKYNLVVIEDSTESLGVSFKGKQTGMFGNFGCFSFNGNKLITTGGGGMIVSEDEKKIEHIRFLINQAADKNRSYYHPEIGFNYRMTNIEAALGLAQLERINSFLDKKRKFTKIYQQILGVLPYVEFQKQYTQAQGARWLNCMVIKKKIDIDSFIRQLKKKNIQTRRIFLPVSEMPYLRGPARKYPNSYGIYKNGICLPSSTINSSDEIKEAALQVRETLEHFRQ